MGADHLRPLPFAVYYGWPSAVRNRTRLLEEGFRVVVLGGGLEKRGHPDQLGAHELVAELRAHGVTAYGYVDVAVGTVGSGRREQTLAGIARLGAGGVLLDNCGGESGVDLARRAGAVEAAHAAGLDALVNCGDPSEALFGMPLRPGDGYLIEGFALAAGTEVPADQLRAKCREARHWREVAGISVYGIATLAPGAGEDSVAAGGSAAVRALWERAMGEKLDYFLVTDPLYGASGPHKDRLSAVPDPAARAAPQNEA